MGNTSTIPVSKLTQPQKPAVSTDTAKMAESVNAVADKVAATLASKVNPQHAQDAQPLSTTAPTTHLTNLITAPVTTKVKVDQNTRAIDKVSLKLHNYLESPIGSTAKTQALKELVHVICAYPKKPVLDLVYKAFVENHNSEALDPMNALQGLQKFAPSDNWKARMLYQVMMKLSSGDSTIRLSTDTIHNVLGEEIATWVTAKIENLKHRRH